jgi:hypothetical protein
LSSLILNTNSPPDGHSVWLNLKKNSLLWEAPYSSPPSLRGPGAGSAWGPPKQTLNNDTLKKIEPEYIKWGRPAALPMPWRYPLSARSHAATLQASNQADLVMETTSKKQQPTTPTDRKIGQRWGPELTSSGWTAIPNVIIQRQKALGLSPLDVNILLQLFAYWWEPDNLPHPSKGTIAAAIGVHPRTVQKRIASMEAAKFINRIVRQTNLNGGLPNKYDFSGLIDAAKPFAIEELQEIATRKKAKAEKLARKKPKLSIVEGGGK